MNWKNTQAQTDSRYAPLSIGLHWLMLLLLAATYASIELRELFPKGSDPRAALKTGHFMLGLLVFVLVWPRLAARLYWPTRPLEAPRWQETSARLIHLALYALMIGMPLAGWLTLSAAGKPIPFFGLELPPLIGIDKELSKQIEEIHETVGTAGYFLIGAHAAAALFHHYVLRDNSLRRILPAST